MNIVAYFNVNGVKVSQIPPTVGIINPINCEISPELKQFFDFIEHEQKEWVKYCNDVMCIK